MFQIDIMLKYLLVFGSSIHMLFSLNVSYRIHLSSTLHVHPIKNVFSSSVMTCAHHCLTTDKCTAATFMATEKLCKLSDKPMNALEYVETDEDEEKSSVVVLLPCSKNPSICKNGGTCVPNENHLHGYECMCTEHWQSQHCDVVKPRCYSSEFEYYEKAKMCYFPSNSLYSYTTGINECLNRNASLAMGNSKDKIDTIFSIVKSKFSWFFLDLTNKNGKWSWGDGSTDYILWRLPGEPSGDGDCATTFPDGYRLNDAPCGTTRKILCEQKAIY